jgi:pimeloyl-ACP methyl ester carboxylesterase
MSELREAEELAVPVHGGDLAVLRWAADRPGAPLVVLVHGITANAMAWAHVATALAGEFEVLAPDLRGRAGSAGLPGPWGLERHAEDVVALLPHADDVPRLLVGHSMGGFVATLAAAGTGRGRVDGVVLVDGGLPLPRPPAADLETAVAIALAPSLDRLGRTFPDLAAVREFWSRHPAVGPWVDDPGVAAYLARDLVEADGGLRSACVPEAVTTDGADGLANERLAEATENLPFPATLLWAARGMDAEPPGLYDEVRLAGLGLDLQHVTAREVPGTDHYSIVWAPEGVAAVTEEVRAAARR